MWCPYTADSKLWCGSLDVTITGKTQTRLSVLDAVSPGRTHYTISRSERNLLQMSPNTEDSCGLEMFAVYKEITSLGKHTDKTSKDSGREEDH